MKPDTGCAGVVLAGGRSRRFGGTDKATVPIGGMPMIGHVVGALVPVVDEVVVNCRPDQESALRAALSPREVTVAVDPIADRGPVVGLRTALRATERALAVVVPCDTPLVPSSLLAHLRTRARHASGAVPTVEGSVRPLPAAMHVRAGVAACSEAVGRGQPTLDDVVTALSPVVVPERDVRAYADPTAFLDVDTPAALAVAEATLARSSDADGRSRLERSTD
ncbi:molybdenum cofactor guanylyltransferase [Salinigranum salinum]|uniref:molybdenum cofactor guanylyltransferase n=1 Tax=Salinigranum salinum TaxID=1364937 RepID=UPI0012606D3E|nr:molybdenum cofactor guanylyltransferase [Salinigranum salinum]